MFVVLYATSSGAVSVRACTNRAGTPATVEPADTSFVTTAPAPTSAPAPIRTPPSMIAPEPIDAPRSTMRRQQLPVAFVWSRPAAVVARGSCR